MPSDVTGFRLFDMQSQTFQLRKGPVFTNLLLADEINRAPAKTQASLLEVMQEQQVTIDGETLHLSPPFMTLATQNPVEHEGTYRLPEAQLDRFMMKIVVGYPTLAEEIQILDKHDMQHSGNLLTDVLPVLTPEALAAARMATRQTHIEPKLKELIAKIIQETRTDKSLFLGASPRASIAIMQVAKALSVIRGRKFVIPEDILEAAKPVLRHRISLTPEREMEGAATDDVIKEILNRMEIPR
jgi:MoxR-like ATPase